MGKCALSNGEVFEATEVGAVVFYAKGAFARPDFREPQNRLTVVFRDGRVTEILGPVALTDAKHLDACGVAVRYEEPPENLTGDQAVERGPNESSIQAPSK